MPQKAKTMYLCSECGFESPRWYGKCPECREWNTISEYIKAPEKPSLSSVIPVNMRDIENSVTMVSDIDPNAEIRRDTGMGELNRVLGGGIVDGSVTLLSGDPGIGKSTLLLQMCKTICDTRRVLYIAGEESPGQIKMRASRIGLIGDNLYVARITDVEHAIHMINHLKPDVVMVDSIQTMNHASVSSSSGSVTQVRECAQALIHAAKFGETPIFLVGHVK